MIRVVIIDLGLVTRIRRDIGSRLSFLLIFALSLSLIPNNSFSSCSNLSLLLLLDSSGSMRKTDPGDLRKLAAQAAVTFLSSHDEVAVIEFSTNAKVLSNWRPVYNLEPIFSAIDKAGNSGIFTDFRAGLEAATKLISKAPKQNRKIILILSDGILEPNPWSNSYPPYYLKFRIETAGKSTAKKLDIYNKKFRAKLSLVARRLIENNILPSLKKMKVEIYTIAFGSSADFDFLRHLANETNLSATEPHFFYAKNPMDLVDTFMKLLHYWKNIMIFYSDAGRVTPGNVKKIFLDPYLRDVVFLVFTEEKSAFSLVSEYETEEESLKGTHPNLKIIRLRRRNPSGTWSYQFKEGTGKYKLLVLGRSMINLEVYGLKKYYTYGESINATIIPTIRGKDASYLLGLGSSMTASITTGNSKNRTILKLQYSKNGFVFKYRPKGSGLFRIVFALYAKNRKGKELLPRPSKTYEVNVNPKFFVEPSFINFGNLKKGNKKCSEIKIHFGFPQKSLIQVTSKMTFEKEKEKIPEIESFSFSINPYQTLTKRICIIAPKNSKWGDYSGKILFNDTKNGKIREVEFQVHVPSLLEKLTLPVLGTIFVLFMSLFLLSIFWGLKAPPVGVLKPIKVPTGIILRDIKLSSIKKGFWSRKLNWRKNVIVLGSKGDVELTGIPDDMRVKLIFHRIGPNYIQNASPKKSGYSIIIISPDIGIKVKRKPKSWYRLSHRLEIIIGEYTFRYEHL